MSFEPGGNPPDPPLQAWLAGGGQGPGPDAKNLGSGKASATTLSHQGQYYCRGRGGASAAEPPVSEELVQRLDPPVSGVMDSPLVLLFAFFSWKWRKKLVQMMAVFGREGGLAKEMAGLLVDAQESGNAATATDNVNMMFCAHSSAYFTRSRSAQNQHVPMSAALDAPASWLVRRPSLLRCCSWAAWLAA